MFSRRSSRRGFTLIESLTVLTVMGTLMAIAVPRFSRDVRQRRVQGVVLALSADVDAVFSLASRNRRPVRVTFDAASSELRAADRNSGALYRRRPVGASSEYTMDTLALTPSTVDVFPNGFASSAFSITVRSGAAARRLDVSRTGLTRVVVP